MSNLAIWMLEVRDLAGGEQLLREAFELRKKTLGPEHADVAGSMTLLADVLIETRRYEEAHGLATEATGIYLKSLGPDHWRTASAVNAQGAALAGLKRYAEAEKLLLESHAVLHRDSAALRYFVKSSDRWLADFYKATGQPEKAAKFLAQAAREG